MKITFDTALDGRIWPDWSSDKTGTFGSSHVGYLGLLDILETLLGLRGIVTPEPIRAAKLVPEISENKTAFWAKSSEVDPLGVAKKLLEMRDYLWMHGWHDQPLTSRLSDLSKLSKKVTPGIPDRLAAVSLSLKDFNGELPEIKTLESIEDLLPCWKDIFNQIIRKGGKVSRQTIDSTLAEGDLLQAREENFNPVMDESLQLVRPEGKLQAAEDIAAWLAAITKEEGLDDTVIIGGDAVLDNALRRYGLPTTGAEAARYDHSLLQLLSLTIAMGWDPPDPARVIELLSLPASPVPPGMGRLLIQALCKWPALGSPDWNQSLDKGISLIKDEKQRQKVQNRLNILFRSDAEGERFPVEAVKDRVNMLMTWLRGRFQDDESAVDALHQCQTFLEVVNAMEISELSEPLLMKLLSMTNDNIKPSSCPSQAGFGSVKTPEALVGSAKRTIWWSFTRDSVAAIDKTHFYHSEEQALAKAGFELSDPGRQALYRASRWRRPLSQTTKQLCITK